MVEIGIVGGCLVAAILVIALNWGKKRRRSAATDVATDDRRGFIRVAPARELPVRIRFEGEGMPGIAQVSDISEDGIRITVPEGFGSLVVSAEVTLRLELPDEPPMICRGIVIHAERQGLRAFFGIRFSHVAIADANRISAYVYRVVRNQFAHLVKRRIRRLTGGHAPAGSERKSKDAPTGPEDDPEERLT